MSLDARWLFGVTCTGCRAFVTVAPDPSHGRPTYRYADTGSVIATCSTCGHRAAYLVSRLERRQAEYRRGGA